MFKKNAPQGAQKLKKGTSSFTVIIVALCLTIIGFVFLPMLPVKLSPDQSLPSINVNFGMRNATSKVLESEVTCKLEAMFARMSGVQEITSTSRNGSGNINIRFDKHTDLDAARFEVSTLIRQIWPELPDGAYYPEISMERPDDGNAQRSFMIFSINAIEDEQSIYNNAERVFKAGFTDIGDVSAVSISGAGNMQWHLEYDYDALRSIGVTVSDIQNAIAAYRTNSNIGAYVITTNISDTTFSLSDICVRTKDSTIVPLSRLVTQTYIRERPWNIMRINGLNSIYLELRAAESANQIALQKLVMQRLSSLKKQLPDGYEIHKIYDATDYIGDELDKIYFRSGLTIVILLIFIYLTTFSWRQLLVVMGSLICNLAVAFVAYYFLGVELHLYSLAAITISLNLMIDNTIIMSDHWRRCHNVKAILPIVAATLTTIGALSIVFFLDDRLRLNLYDFAVVMIVNLLLSIFTALWLVPAMINMQKDNGLKRFSRRRLRFAVRFNRVYGKFVNFTIKRRWIAYLFVIFVFGLPLFMMPREIKGTNWFARSYNTVFGSKLYNETIRPYTDVIFGGTLRLFVEKVYNGSYWSRNDEVVLSIYATLPYGSTIGQMDYLMRQMESYLSKYQEIKQFTTNLSAQSGSIQVYFTKEAAKSSFPYMLKSQVISKGLQLGGGSWSVYGLQDQGFSNDVRESVGSYKMDISGYNYETLLQWADSIRAHLLTYMRIKEVAINAREMYYKSDYMEYRLTPNLDYMAHQGIPANYLFYVLPQIFVADNRCGEVWNDGRRESITLSTLQSDKYDIWSLLNRPVEIGGRIHKLGQLCRLEKLQAPQEIVKTNQQYNLCVQFEYIGSSTMGQKAMMEADSIYSARLPIGYSVKSGQNYYSWRDEDSRQYWLLGLVVAIIFFTTSILFNSLRLPLVIISVIPVSYVGLFLTFFLFGLNFDQGGFAALILLCGITVNASIYIVDEYRQYLRRYKNPRKSFVKAFSIKIIPIMLTILSTILGFIPFMVGDGKEAFWFPLAAGTIGGLVMSLVGIVMFLPGFLVKGKN